MVVSRIDESIEYPPVKFIDAEDLEYDAQLYEIEIFQDIPVVIALGQVKYIYVDKKVLFIPVYLTNNGEVLTQIGIYEFHADNYTSLLDEDNDFDISLLDDPIPLLYKFANELFIRKKIKLKKKSPAEIPAEVSAEIPAEVSAEIPAEVPAEIPAEMPEKESKSPLDEDSRVPNDQTILEELIEEDDDEAPKESKELISEEEEQILKFKPHGGHSWVEKFMRNENYGIEDVESNGDCFFATIREGFAGIGKGAPVPKLREIVSNAATETIFKNFREQYDMHYNELKNLTQEQKDIQGKVAALRKLQKSKKDRNERKALVDEAAPLIQRFKKIKKEKVFTNEMISEYKWMKGIDTLEKLKHKIKTTSFWAESWAIQTIELALNIKTIILSSDNYVHGDLDNVLLCGEMVSPIIEEKGSFKPKYYIIIEHTGNHYKLITYNKKRIFKLNDIPQRLKRLIVDKCMEKESGTFNYIPKFKILKQRMTGDDAGPEDIGDRKKEGEDEGSDVKKSTFDETTVLQFYSKSSDKPLPGKGAGEKINPSNQHKFADLANITGWRKVLSNFHMAPFKLDGRTWNSVEHYYHANKFKKGHPEFYEKFTVESGSDISKSAAFAKSAGGKTGKYKSAGWKRDKSIVMDADFFEKGKNQRVMEAGQYAKYSQNEDAKKVLLATKDAKLQHHVRGSPPIVFYDSMRVREKL